MAQVKICGIRDRSAAECAIAAGAAYLGLVLVETSPRHIPWPEARTLATHIAPRATPVFLIVGADAAMKLVQDGLPPGAALQLHGDEPPAALTALKQVTNAPLIKAIGVHEADDLDAIADYASIADLVLLDAKPPPGADRTGGHGQAFEWSLLSQHTPSTARAARAALEQTPWMLAGGLTPDNVTKAVEVTGAPMVDVSSGVERAPGVKDPAKIEAFVAAARAAKAPGAPDVNAG